MKMLLKVGGGLVLLLIVVVAGFFITGNGPMLVVTAAVVLAGPGQDFDPADAVAPPDYTDLANWAALPDRADLADLIPAGVADAGVQETAPVDVFFIHPTGFINGASWTFSMDPNTSTEENTLWMMANQASPYNGCCKVYAPRYRQASIFAYFSGDEIRDEVLAFAYQDVERAFDYFLANYSHGRPFVIASHSQGTHHAARLLAEQIDGTPLAQRLVAAYIIGGGVKRSHFDAMADIGICDSPQQTGCAVHWDTHSDAALPDSAADSSGNVCVNPLTWRDAGGLADASEHLGAVPGSGEFYVNPFKDDVFRDVEFGPLGEPLPGYVQAQCHDGALYITDQSETRFGKAGAIGTNYHGLDYPIFHMDIRENAKLRVAAYLAANPAP